MALVRELVRDWLHSYGYRNIRMPLVEPTALFKRAIGEVTDIVEKEMYSFADALNGDELTLRPRVRHHACVQCCSTICCITLRSACITVGRCSAMSVRKRGVIASFINTVWKRWALPDRTSMRTDSDVRTAVA